MKYSKPTLTYEKQAERLLEKGLIANKELLVSTLQSMSYYRLSAYLYPFKQITDEGSTYNVSLEKILHIYSFDRELRLLVLDIIERIEISFRNDVIHLLGMKHGVFSYVKKETLPQLSDDEFNKLIKRIEEETDRSRETFKEHFFDKYSDDYLPIWMLTEVLSFGTLLKIFKGISLEDKKEISKKFDIHPTVLDSWLFTINTVRNICAHHSRLWNKTIGFKSIEIKKTPNEQLVCLRDQTREKIFGNLTILKYMLNRIPVNHGWDDKFYKLLDCYQDIPLHSMGFPDNWRELAIWK